MIEYIDRHKAIHAIKEHCEDTIQSFSPDFPVELRNAYIMAHQHCMTVLSLLPASVEEKPMKGKWHELIRYGADSQRAICECSVCGGNAWVYDDKKRRFKYCPNCGAKMESEARE